MMYFLQLINLFIKPYIKLINQFNKHIQINALCNFISRKIIFTKSINTKLI